MKSRLLLLLLLAGILAACEEDKLTPSDPQEFYEFPQGNADYDQEFVAFYEKYNTQFLYKYREADFRWNVTEYIPYYSVPADEAYVGKAYRLIKEKCLDVWGETFCKEMLPLRILLASEVYSYETKSNWVYDPEIGESVQVKYNDTTWHAAAYGLNHVTFGYTSDKLDNLTPQEQLDLVGELNKSFIGYAASRGKIEIPEKFIELHNKYRNNQWDIWSAQDCGFLEYNKNIDVAYDFGLYVKYLTTMSEEAFQTWISGIGTGSVWDQDAGMYKPTNAIPQKYQLVLDYFKTQFGIDLHAMGNRVANL